jgi:hypothetical protein
MLGKWEIHYLAFQGPEDCQKPPLLCWVELFKTLLPIVFLW